MENREKTAIRRYATIDTSWVKQNDDENERLFVICHATPWRINRTAQVVVAACGSGVGGCDGGANGVVSHVTMERLTDRW